MSARYGLLVLGLVMAVGLLTAALSRAEDNRNATAAAGEAAAEAARGNGETMQAHMDAPRILWRDSIETTRATPFSFSGAGVEHPVGGPPVAPSDEAGVNLSRVPNPIGEGFALRHLATFDQGGSRSQLGLYGDVNTIFGKQAQRPEGVWVAQEWYFPEAIKAVEDRGSWINLWDWHSIDADRGNRWHTAPGMMLAQDGSMRFRLTWGGDAGRVNQSSELSSVALPVGRWFDIEMHYVWTAERNGTIRVWVDGQLALEQQNVQTRAESHTIAETYMKFYGAGGWTPTPSLKYTRNVRVAGERIRR